MHIRYGLRSDVGKIRTSNEDSYAGNPKNRLFLVADGMGGHAAGEIASQIAASTVEEVVARQADSPDPGETVLAAAREANERIYTTQRQNPELSGMGSTLTVLHMRDRMYFIAQVGDSRAYLLRDGRLEQLTRDHSLVWHLYESGVLRKDELSSHPQKNLITRSIGPHPAVEIDLERGNLRDGDLFLLCSDGLTDVVTDDGIRRILSEAGSPPDKLSDKLVAAANAAGGPDNVTVIVVRVEADPSSDDEDTGKFRAI